jgi:hypothetical protein
MKTSDQLTWNSFLALLLVGEPKTGKTTVELAFPDPFILNVDKNLDGPRRRAVGKKFWFDDPMLDVAGKELPPEKRWDRSMELLKEAHKSTEVKTICIDSLTGLSDYLVDHILDQVRIHEGKKIDRPRIQDYYSVKDLLARFAVMLRTISKTKHVIIAAHQKADVDEATKATRYSLNIPGQQAQNWGSYFTDVWATTATDIGGKTKYEIRTKPTGFHVSLGTSLPMEPRIDVTDKSPDEIWAMLSPKLSIMQTAQLKK